MSAGDVHSILYRGENPLDILAKPKVVPPKVKRYWAGKVPEYVNEIEEAEAVQPTITTENIVELENAKPDTSFQDKRLQRLAAASASVNESQSERTKKRLAELQQAVDAFHDAEESNEIIHTDDMVDYIQQKASEDYSQEKQSDEVIEEGLTAADWYVYGSLGKLSVEEENDLIKRRARIKEKALQKRKQEELMLNGSAATTDYVEDSLSNEESETDEEDVPVISRVRPLFVPKGKRLTAHERQLEALAQAEIEEARRQKEKEKKEETKQLLIDAILKDEIKSNAEIPSDTEMPDDTDGVNPTEEYELWKIRALKRIKRDLERSENRATFLEDIEKRRQMTEEHRMEDNKRLDAMAPKKEKKFKYAFMQKYYHQGAYFQDKALSGSEPLYLRDYAAPVGEDKVDKSTLPKPMQLRRGLWGKQGQVKHTHLADVDTTDFTAAWADPNTVRPKRGLKKDNL